MEDKILDFFPEDHQDFGPGEIIIIKFFYFETPARIYAARLKEANIPSFVSNSTTSIPFGNGSISLHIRKVDQEKAVHIVHQLDKRNLLNEVDEDESFHDADHDDIAYQKALHEKDRGLFTPIVIFAIIVIAFIIAFVINNPVDAWR